MNQCYCNVILKELSIITAKLFICQQPVSKKAPEGA